MSLAFQIIFTVIGAFLSVILTKFLIQNGRAIAENGRAIAENGRAIAENGRAIAENGRAIAEIGKKLDERTAKIAELIVAEGEKTRELIKSLRSG